MDALETLGVTAAMLSSAGEDDEDVFLTAELAFRSKLAGSGDALLGLSTDKSDYYVKVVSKLASDFEKICQG